MYYQDCNNKYYTKNFYEDHIEIIINFFPKGIYNKAKMYVNLEPYFIIDNTIIKYNNKIFHNKDELMSYFKTLLNDKSSL